MKNQLKEQLQLYIAENYPEKVHQLNPDVPFSTYMEDRVNLIEPLMDELISQGKNHEEILDICMDEIISVMPPSKYNYLLEVMEEEFPAEYDTFKSLGVLQYTVINIMQQCEDAFEAFDFSHDTIDDRFMRYMVIAEIHDYFLLNQKHN
jgi:hypothetical protein